MRKKERKVRPPENPEDVPDLLLMLGRRVQRLMGRSIPRGWSFARIRDRTAEEAISVTRAGQLDVLLLKHPVLVHLDDTHARHPVRSPVQGTALHLILRNGGNWPSRAQRIYVEAESADGSCDSVEEVIIPWL